MPLHHKLSLLFFATSELTSKTFIEQEILSSRDKSNPNTSTVTSDHSSHLGNRSDKHSSIPELDSKIDQLIRLSIPAAFLEKSRRTSQGSDFSTIISTV